MRAKVATGPMLTTVRRVARPLTALVLAAFLAPGAVLQCSEISAIGKEVMACCKPGGAGAGLKAECCVLDDARPASERPSSTAASARPSFHALTAEVEPVTLALPAPPRDGTATDHPDHAPPDRLYIRYAVIRR